MIEVFNKIYLDNRLLSFNELNLYDFSIDELRFLKSIYSSKEEKIDKFIEKQKLSSYNEKEISKILDGFYEELSRIENKTFIFDEITDDEEIRHIQLLKDISKYEEIYIKLKKYK